MSNGTPLSITERIDILKSISRTNRKIHEGRIERELKFVITTLSFYAACVIIKYRLKDQINFDVIFDIIAWLAIIIIGFFVIKYLMSSKQSNYINQSRAEYSENILLELLNDPDIDNSLKEHKINELINKLKQIGNAKNPPIDSKCCCQTFIEKLNLLWKDVQTDEGHPSKNRWLWQVIIVIFGAIISSTVIIYPLFKSLICIIVILESAFLIKPLLNFK